MVTETNFSREKMKENQVVTLWGKKMLEETTRLIGLAVNGNKISNERNHE